MLEQVEVSGQTVVAHQPSYISFDEYLALTESRFAEWVDGEVVYTSPVTVDHQSIAQFLTTLIRMFLAKHDIGTLLTAPFAMRLAEQQRGREPDLFFVVKGRSHLIKRTYLDGPADLAVEIVSPESIGRDRGEKYIEYEAAGVREYWLIDPERRQAEFYVLGTDGFYHLESPHDGIFRSRVIPQFSVRIVWFWQDSSSMSEAVKELGLLR